LRSEITDIKFFTWAIVTVVHGRGIIVPSAGARIWRKLATDVTGGEDDRGNDRRDNGDVMVDDAVIHLLI
jgi:hypothetical protein